MDRKIGFVCFGEVNTPLEKLEEKHDQALESLKKMGMEVIDGGGTVFQLSDRVRGRMGSFPCRYPGNGSLPAYADVIVGTVRMERKRAHRNHSRPGRNHGAQTAF